MKKLPLLLSLAVFSSASISLSAQETPAPEAASGEAAATEPTRAEVERYASMVTERIERRKQRATDLVNEIVKLDASVQKGVDQVLGLVKNMRDSKDSKTRVARTKREMMDRLGKAIERYAHLRGELQEELRASKSGFKREELFSERDVFDKKINKMVDEIINLAMTMDVHEDHEKYKVTGGGGWGWGWNRPVYQNNPEYAQNRRATRQTSAARKELEAALSKAIGKLDIDIRNQKEKLKSPALTGENREIAQDELKRLETIHLRRNEQLASLFTLPPKNKGRKMGLRETIESEKFMESVLQDVRRDFDQMVARYREYRVERDAIAEMKEKLMDADSWLETHAK